MVPTPMRVPREYRVWAHVRATCAQVPRARVRVQMCLCVSYSILQICVCVCHAAYSRRQAPVLSHLVLCSLTPRKFHNRDQDTPLHAAAKSGTEETVRALLEHGASKDATNAMGNVPEKLAIMFAKTSVAKVPSSCPVCDTRTRKPSPNSRREPERSSAKGGVTV
jgi:hypothetical protein